MDWLIGKHAIVVALNVSTDALHLLGGILLYLLLAFLFDRRVRSTRALVLVAILLAALEGGDWLAYRSIGKGLAFARMWPDVVGGLCWPVLLYILGPRLIPAPARRADADG